MPLSNTNPEFVVLIPEAEENYMKLHVIAFYEVVTFISSTTHFVFYSAIGNNSRNVKDKIDLVILRDELCKNL